MGLIKSSEIRRGAQSKNVVGRQPDWTGRQRSDTASTEPSEQDIQSSLSYLQQMESRTKEKMDIEYQRFMASLESEKKKMLSDVDRIKSEAREQGKGEGITLGKKEYSEKAAEYFKAIAEMAAYKSAVLLKAKRDLLNLSTEIAEHLIRTQLTLNPEAQLNIVHDAIAKLSDRERVTVRVGQADVEFLRQNRDRIIALTEGVKNLTIEEDASIPSGGCVIETNLGYVDSRVNLKLDAIREAFGKKFAEDEKTQMPVKDAVDSKGVSQYAPAAPAAPTPVVAVPAPVKEEPKKLVAMVDADDAEDDDDDINDLFNDADLDDLWDDDELFGDDEK